METASETARVQREVVSLLGAVTIHARQQNLPCAAFLCLLHPFQDIDSPGFPAAMGVDLPPGIVSSVLPLRVHGHDDALAAETSCAFLDELGALDGRGVD